MTSNRSRGQSGSGPSVHAFGVHRATELVVGGAEELEEQLPPSVVGDLLLAREQKHGFTNAIGDARGLDHIVRQASRRCR